jgi:hypothetical protein
LSFVGAKIGKTVEMRIICLFLQIEKSVQNEKGVQYYGQLQSCTALYG